MPSPLNVRDDVLFIHHGHLIGARVHAGVPPVLAHQEAVLAVAVARHVTQPRLGARAIALGRGELLQYVVILAIVVMRFGEVIGTLSVGRHDVDVARRVRGALPDGPIPLLGVLHALALASALRGVKRELGTRHGGAVLVVLADGALRHALQVEHELHVGIGVAALEVEELERVVAAGQEGVRVLLEVRGGLFLAEGLLEACTQSRLCAAPSLRGILARVAEFDLAGLEVDGERRGSMDAAQVAHEHTVDEDPHVVVARELELHVLTRHHAARGLGEIGSEVESEIVVHQRILRVNVLGNQGTAGIPLKHLILAGKGEELADRLGARVGLHTRLLVEVELVLLRVVDGEVLGAVIRVIAVDVLHEALDVTVGALAGRGRVVEEIREGLFLCCEPTLGLVDVSSLEHGVAIRPEGRLDDAEVGLAALARPCVDGVRCGSLIPARVAEAQLVPLVDPDIPPVARIIVVRGVLRDDPVVKQVDGGVLGRLDPRHEVLVCRGLAARALRRGECGGHGGQGERPHEKRDEERAACTALRGCETCGAGAVSSTFAHDMSIHDRFGYI